MKYILTILFLYFCNSVFATNYFVKNAGNDSNNGLSDATAWRTIDKVNTVRFTSGDSIFFNRGDTFYGKIYAGYLTGTSASRIIYTSYGTGNNPIITGFTTLTGWVDKGGGIWEITQNIGAHVEVVLVNGRVQGRGRYPNKGFTVYGNPSGDSVIYSAGSSAKQFIGGEVVIRKSSWTLTRDKITKQSGDSIYYTRNSTDINLAASNGFGYFIQNHIATLDTLNEWYSDGINKFSMYFGANNPASYDVKVAQLDTLFSLYGSKFISIRNITFEGAANMAVKLGYCEDVSIENCTFRNIAISGVNATLFSVRNRIDSCTFTDIFTNAISIGSAAHNSYVGHNNIKNVNKIPGSGSWGGAAYDWIGDGIWSPGNDSTVIEYNVLDSTGHIGIKFSGFSDTVRYNKVSNSGITRNDVGAIYIWTSAAGKKVTDAAIYGNILIDNNGTAEGITTAVPPFDGSGIYIDFGSGISIYNNYISNTGTGIILQGIENTRVFNNTVFAAEGSGIYISQSNVVDAPPFNNNSVTNNIVIEKYPHVNYYNLPASNQPVNSAVLSYTNSKYGGIPTSADTIRIDSNIYARPIDNVTIINSKVTTDASWFGRNLTLAGWKTYSGKDANSTTVSKTVTNPEDLRFEYNATTSSKTIPLDGGYIDARGNQYPGSITLAPFTGIVLIKDSSVIPQPNLGKMQLRGNFKIKLKQ